MKRNSTFSISLIVALVLFCVLGNISNVIGQTWTSVDGGGTYGINTSTATYSRIPSTAVFNGLLYSAWQEQNSGVDQVHIKSYNGTTWTAAGESSSSKLNSSSTNALKPKIAYYNGALYAAYEEYDASIYRIHVKKYNGTSWSLVENYSAGDGRTTINKGVTANATEVDLIVYNGYLYAAWAEVPTAGVYNIRVSQFDGSFWTSVDGGGTYGLNYNTSKLAHTPRFAVYNSQLYLTWIEDGGASSVYQVRVRRYDGSSAWTFVDGNASAGLNYNSGKQASNPVMTSYNNSLYLLWSEPYEETYYGYGDIDLLRVRKFDGSSWSFVDGGGSTSGWNLNILDGAFNPECLVANGLLYVIWNEPDDMNFYNQIRAVTFNGTTKSFIDGGGVTSNINYNSLNDAEQPVLTNYLGNIYALWHEERTSGLNNDQIRAKKTLLSPFVESVSVPSDGTYFTGQSLTFTVNYSKDVVVSGGTPYIPITLNTGGTVNASYTGGSGTSTLTFSYTIVSGNVDTDGIFVGWEITLPGGCTLQSEDATPLTASLTLYNVSSTTGVLVDATGPTVTSVSSTTADGYYNTGDVIVITITCSEAATVTGAPTLALNSGGTASYTSGSGTTVLTFSYTVASGHNSADLDYSSTSSLSLSGGTIRDATGNDATLTLPAVGGANSLGGQKNIVIDNVAPTVTLSSTATDPTNASSIPVTITFSESVSGFVVGDITVTNGTAGSFTTVNAYTYTTSITPTAAGTVTVNVAGSVATDAAGNNNTAATALTRVYDNVAPTVTITSTAGDPTNTSPILVTITFSESVSGFVVGDISVTNGTAGSFTTVNAYTYTASITPTAAGSVTINVAGSVATDVAGNNNSAATALTRVYDNVAPTVTITSTAGDPTNTSPIPVTITFSESVSGFVVGDISATNGTAGSFTTVNAYTYTASITPTAAGTVTVNVAGSVATDAAGNNNTAATALTRVYDNVAPMVTITSTAGDPTNTSPIPVTITFSESVTGFVVGDITVTNGTAGSFTTVNAYTYTANITPSAQGVVNVGVAAGVAADAAGNNNTSATQLTRTFDNVAPTVTITSTAGDPTNTSPILVTITFSESVSGFVVGDISVTNGTAGSFTTVNAYTYTASITPAVAGTVTVNVAGSVASDAAGNNNTAATALTRVYDNVAPTVTITSTAGDPTNASPLPVTITFSEPVTGFVVGDITVTNGIAGSFTTVNAYTYTTNITPTAQGAVNVDVAAGVAADAAGNSNTSATQLTRTFDNVAPTVTITSTAGDSTNASPIPVTITFSESVTGFVVGDISVTNGTAGSFTTVNAYTYTASITPSGNGTVTVNVAGSVGTDAAGNSNTAATALTRVYDNVEPTVTITSTAGDPTNASPILVTITFSESVTGFVVGDISVTNGTAGSFATVNAYTYTASITPIVAGTVTVNVAGSVATDAAGNNNTAATALTRVYDNVAPTVTITSTTGDPTNTSPIPVTITFSESITGFVVGDISVTNGTAGSFTTVNAYTYTTNITPTAQGAVNVDVAAGVAADAAGNSNTSAAQLTRTFDNVAPTVMITSTADDPTNASLIPVTITFSESVTGFVVGDITVTNGTASGFSGSGSTYTVDITPLGEGLVTVGVDAGVAHDVVGNGNTAAAQFSRTYIFPTINFTTTLQSSVGESGIMTITAQLSAASISDVTVPFTVNSSSTATAVSDYSITPSPIIITAGNTTGTITIAIVVDDLDENDETVIVDMGTPTNATLGVTTSHTATITDDDETPVITALQGFTIDENSIVGTVVGTVVATDPDAGTTFSNWTITTNVNPDGDGTDAFAINSASGQITVLDAGDLDREANSSFTIKITVSDGTNTSTEETVTIDINDMNDVTPVITASQELHVTEQSPNGSIVGTVVATDGDITSTTFQNWTITDGNSNGYFAVNASTGVITVVDNTGLNSNINQSFTLTLTVSDGVNTSLEQTVLIIVSAINDENPVVTPSQSLTIDENSANSTFVGQVLATDPDYGTVFQDWTITAGNTNDAFAINPNTGEITVNSVSVLDYEAVSSFALTVQVSDGLHTASDVVTINLNNLNDNSPVVTDATFALDENSVNAAAVGTVAASDADGSLNNLNYSITSGNTNSAFVINSANGEISVNTSSELDYESVTSFSLTIQVSDGTHTGSGVITVNLNNLNDNSPVVTDATLALDENSANATAAGTVAASDADGSLNSLNYSITAGNTNSAFVINSANGEISVNTSSELDYESVTSFSLTIQVSDGTHTGSGVITVNLNNLNDNSPVVTDATFALDENSANATAVGTVTASDVDGSLNSLNYSITSGNTNSAFVINSANGEISVNTSSELDYESIASFSLTIQVSDGTHTGSGVITVTLNNLNDNSPVVTDATFALDENSANATVVGTVTASDADGTLNSLSYSITAGNTNNAFAINPSSGAITVNNTQALDFETIPIFNLVVSVSDGTHSSDGNITVNLNDVVETGIDDNKSLSFKVYPNPANERISVSFENISTNSYRIEIYNLIGCKIYQRIVDKPSEIQVIDLINFAEGIYFVKAFNKQFSFTEKLVIHK